MAEKPIDIPMTTAEKQILEHPDALRFFLSILVPCITGFNIYVAASGRVLASAVLCLQLAGFIAVLGVIKSRLPEVRKILCYRHIFSFQILVFGLYLILTVGIKNQIEVSFWCFLYIFLVSLWMPERTAAGSIILFNLGIILPAFLPEPDRFIDNSEMLSRFYIALLLFSLLAMVARRFRQRYLDNLYRMRTGLEESEKKYLALNTKLVQEIEYRDRIEERLHHAIKMETLGQVAAGVAHDLNNILSGLVTYPELLMLDLDEDHPMMAPLETIRSSGTRAAAIVSDLLALSRRGVAALTPVDLCRTVEEYLASPEHRQLMADHRQARVVSLLETPSAVVTGSGVHLSKTLMNLVANGVEALAGPGKVTVRVDLAALDVPRPLKVQIQGEKEIPPGRYARLTVSDTGTGIALENQEAVFEPFYTSKKMGRSGTGLGMALVLASVIDHGGYIRLVSSPEKGTAVSLYFPEAKETQIPKQGDAGLEAVRGAGESILVVDDEPVQRHIAQSLLTHLGYKVAVCDSGEAALSYLRKEQADLVIMDIIMEPGMTGVEACEALLTDHPAQRILFATGYSNSQTLARATRMSRGDCLFKPYTPEKLGAMVKERLAMPGAS